MLLLSLPLLTLCGLLASAARLPALAYLPPAVPQPQLQPQLPHVERQQQELWLPQQQEYALDLPLEPY